MSSVRHMGEGEPTVARANSGSLHSRMLADGTRVFRLRFKPAGSGVS